MDTIEEIQISPLFDFSSFFNTGYLSDCMIYFGAKEDHPTDSVKAHVLVLANGSRFFYDSFTSQMREDKERVFYATVNPMNLLRRVLRYLYNGQISYEFDETMALLKIATYYMIDVLKIELQNQINSITDPNLYINLVNQCYDNQIEDQLPYLSQFIIKNYNSYDIQTLSDSYDVMAFAAIIRQVQLPIDKLISDITAFLGDFEADEEELAALNKLLFDYNTEDKRKAFEKSKPKWIK
ncbi:hypothetical protein TVAG_495100 [Trichomonas vaginalis G3]|uniref:BTB domain-containing protein n=1 Tax=Trichomonas vaginalis (strain ATCC PRA-98 / G3) TaxID=412133 RepID=A2FWP5_TRIV3|nr:Potassium Channel Kv1.1, Chain A domain-containing protein [Trichomonas vaginalis G3]EAX90673.1 hypothetical protein TVAG_495100 [Trichomonas vaginalis G3]KAI5553987.1 Potassium Channel Kv1.1, Chain A domain-containing protein [Trichomonas vaginalis G3]|eukprot:XP_001303603.1 hypothetical protein [Trichomonas vaginalis G3]